MSDFHREERTVTTVRHVVATPVNYVDVQKLLRTVINDMTGGEGLTEPNDDQIWYEVGDDQLAICYELTTGTTGGWTNREPLK